MTALLVAVVASYGVFLLYTGFVFGWRGVGLGPGTGSRRRGARDRAQAWLAQAGLADVGVSEVGTVSALLFLAGGGVAFALFGGVLPSIVAGGFAATFPVASLRSRRERRRTEAREAWPRMIEEMRLLTGSLGRSVPQALFDVGRRSPEDMRAAFRAAQREWMISTDFPRTLAVLKKSLADATADVVCETLLVAYEVGGTDLDHRL
ncbi:MAG TPA: hypothetical protein VKV34_01080, partial [Thermoleophilia bacterium]|nr:hypothetical protein [Thermoleophilia bacterium]